MLKRFAAAGAVAAVLTVAVAYAQGATKSWTDPQNRFSFQYPAAMGNPDVSSRPNQPLNVVVGLADYECQGFAVDRAESASSPPDAVARAYAAPLTADLWKRSADGFALYGRQGTVTSVSVDTSKFWPVQRAVLQSDEQKTVTAAMQARPGLEFWQFCVGFDARDHSPVFTQIINSFAGPNDAALQAQAEAAMAERNAKKAANDSAAAAAAAGAGAKAAPAAEQKKKREGRRLPGQH